MKAIIKNGKYNSVVCSDCGCEYYFEKSDVTSENKVSCPQCGQLDSVPVKN